jgi:hypothetical protein
LLKKSKKSSSEQADGKLNTAHKGGKRAFLAGSYESKTILNESK